MNMSELSVAFSKLNLIEKRNQISNELMTIANLIKTKENLLGLPSKLEVKNYNVNTQSNLTESEILDFIYEDIYNIEKELITVLALENK